MKQKEDKTIENLIEYLKESNLKDKKKFPKLQNEKIEFYTDFTASEAAVITKVRTLKMLPKIQYYPSYIKEFNDNELTQFICDLVKYGNEKINWEKIEHANEAGKKYREEEIKRRNRSQLRALEEREKAIQKEKEKLKQQLNMMDE